MEQTNMELTPIIKSKIKINEMEEIARATFPKESKIFTHGAAIFLILFSLYKCTQTNLITSIIIGIICLVAVIVLETSLKRREEKFIKTIIQRLKESNSGDEIVYEYQLLDEVISVNNKNTDGHIEMDYYVFTKYLETEHYVLLLTVGKQYIIFNKDIANENELFDFIKEKNSKIKYEIAKF